MIAGLTMGPLGSVFGGLAGAIVGALVGGAVGGTAGVRLGEIIDENVLKNFLCLACENRFSGTDAAASDNPFFEQ